MRIQAFILTVVTAQFTFADTITLKESIHMDPSSHVIELSDVAHLEGEFATEFSDLTLKTIDKNSGQVRITIDEIRARLDEAGAHWGRVNLTGRAVSINFERGVSLEPPQAMTPIDITPRTDKPIEHSPPTFIHSADIINQSSVQGAIARLIAQQFHMSPANLRLQFSHEITQVVEHERFTVHPIGSLSSNRIHFAIRTRNDNQTESRYTLTVDPLLHVEITRLLHNVSKNHTITESDVELIKQWMPPSQAERMIHRVRAIGRMTARSISTGEVLHESDLRKVFVVERGDPVIVHCRVGGVMISLQAEARDDAATGDTIEFRKRGERETFLARVTAPGEAILDLSRHQ